MEKNINVALIF